MLQLALLSRERASFTDKPVKRQKYEDPTPQIEVIQRKKIRAPMPKKEAPKLGVF